MVVTIDPAEVGSPYREPPPSVKLIPGPNFDAEGFSLSDIWSELPYSDTPLYGDVDSMTGVLASASAEDLINKSFLDGETRTRALHTKVNMLNSGIAMACAICRPATTFVGLAITPASAVYDGWDGVKSTAFGAIGGGYAKAATGNAHLADQLGATVDLGTQLYLEGKK